MKSLSFLHVFQPGEISVKRDSEFPEIPIVSDDRRPVEILFFPGNLPAEIYPPGLDFGLAEPERVEGDGHLRSPAFLRSLRFYVPPAVPIPVDVGALFPYQAISSRPHRIRNEIDGIPVVMVRVQNGLFPGSGSSTMWNWWG